MDIATTFITIRKLHTIVCGVDKDVCLTYNGGRDGLTKNWDIQVGGREAHHETYEGALLELLSKLKDELAEKIRKTKAEADRLSHALHSMDN
jgi:hypothetical protein